MIKHATTLCLFLLAATTAVAAIRVPADQPDLPAALAAAAVGDTIRIAASHTVSGGLVLPDLGLSIEGGWDDTFTERSGRTPVTAAIDAPSLTVTGQGTRLLGLTISPGDGALRDQPVSGRYGGGVLVRGDDHHLADLVIDGALLGSASELGAGGGLALIETNSVVEDCSFQGNQATWGGAVFVDGGAPILRRLAITDNLCGPDAAGQSAQGAGVMVRSANATLEDCTISGGRGAARGGGVAWIGIRGRTLRLDGCDIDDNTMVQDGGGLYGQDGVVEVLDCRFRQNRLAPDVPFSSGGGAYLTGARVSVSGSTFAENAAAAGGGMTVNEGAEVTVDGCVFLANEADQFGAALNYQRNDAGEVRGNTLAGNVGPLDAGVLHLASVSVPVTGNLVAFNEGVGVLVTSGTPAVTCNDVVSNTGGGWSGLDDPTGQDGNLSADPLFCDLPGGDVSLDAASPCLAAPGCGLIGALDQGCGGGVAAPVAARPDAVLAYPNPANPAVILQYDLALAGAADLTIHDARGRLVRRLVHGHHQAGRHRIRWDGGDERGRAVPSGIYVYRLSSGSGTTGGRLTILR